MITARNRKDLAVPTVIHNFLKKWKISCGISVLKYFFNFSTFWHSGKLTTRYISIFAMKKNAQFYGANGNVISSYTK
jgi:hypothetical protein